MPRKMLYLQEEDYREVVQLAGLLQAKEGKKVFLGEAVGRACRFMRPYLEEGASV